MNKGKPVKHSGVAAKRASDDDQGRRLAATGTGLLRATAGLLGAMIVWAFLAPMDATSVFLGSAVVQNLFWMLAGALCATAAYLRGGLHFSRLDWAFGLLAGAWLIAVTLAAGLDHNPRTGWHGFWQVISLVSCYLCARSVFVGQRARACGLVLILTGCLAVSVQGLYQVGVELPSIRARYEADPDAEIARIDGLYAPPGSPQRARYEARLFSPEPYASYALANSLATVLSSGLLLGFALCLTHWADRHRSRDWWLSAGALVLATGLMFGTWLLTRSRSAYLAVFIAATYSLLLTQLVRSLVGRKALYVFLSVLGVVCLLSAAWLFTVDREVLDEAPKSIAFRLEYWQATMKMITDRPLLGTGLGNFQATYPQYKLPTASEEIADPHNWVLDIAATLSVPVALLVLFWLGRIYIQQQQPYPADSPQQSLAIDLDASLSRCLVYGAVVGGILCGLLMSLLQNHELFGGLLIGWTVAVVLSTRLRNPCFSAAGKLPQAGLVAATAILICLLATGSWQATGIAVPGLVLIASNRRGMPDLEQRRSPSRIGPIALAGLGLACFIFQAWRPVTVAWQFAQEAQVATSWTQQRAALLAAIDSDPWDANYLANLAQAEVQFATSDPSPSLEWNAKQKCFPAIDAWLARDQRKFTNWRQAGHLALELFAASQRGVEQATWMLERAGKYYQGAVDRYPTSTELRLQLAAVSALSGDEDKYRVQIAAAERLSELTPHEDKKLENQLIWLPLAQIPATFRVNGGREVRAEPLMDWLRTEESRLFAPNQTQTSENDQ